MSEEWRRKPYYRTRVLIPVEEVLDSAFGDCLVCLTGGQLNLVRNLLLYAERRSTFVSEYEPNTYLAPTTEEWDNLETVVADLEGNLMDCEQFTSDLQEILDWVRLQSTLPGGSFSEDEQAAFPYDDVIGDDDLTPAEEDACAIAQLWFEWGYQVVTEQVLPATRWGFDYLVPAVAGFIALAIGGPPAAMGVYALAELIQELLEIFYRGAETNLVNWMDTNKQDIVCALFGFLKVGGDASTIWSWVEELVIDPAEDISYGDKLILHLFMGSWAGSNALKAFEAETEWATSNVEGGYCAPCDPVPLIWEWDIPPHTGWSLSPVRSEWTVEGWGHFWRGDGGIFSPWMDVNANGAYILTVRWLGYGVEVAPNGSWILLESDTIPAAGGPIVDQMTNLTVPIGTWTEMEYEREVTIAKRYIQLRLAAWGDTDPRAQKVKWAYLKLVPDV